MDKILVWDWPVRVSHWLLVGAFSLAWVTGDSEEWRLVHAYAGGTLIAVVLFRLVWGLIGTHHARFAHFVRGPASVFNYLNSLRAGKPPHTTGHNPAGGWAIVSLLVLGLVTGASGWLVYQDIGGDALAELHEGLSSAMLIVVGIHVAGVFVGSFLHRENLIRAMLSGYKQGSPGEAIVTARPLVVLILIGWVAVCAWWLAR